LWPFIKQGLISFLKLPTMSLRKIFFLIPILFLGLSAFSQLSKGVLKLKVNNIKLNGEEAPSELAASLGNMEVTIYSDGKTQKSVMSMMMMKTTSIINTKEDSTHLYMDMMGKKYKISESRKMQKDSMETKNKAVITEYPEDTKEILGFKCHRVDIHMNLDMDTLSKNSIDMKVYVTNELNFDASYLTQTGKNINIKGTPLEYNMNMGSGSFKMEMNMLAKEFTKEVKPEDLLPPPGEFKIYTMEQFQKEMGRMGKR
jgi:hypothetical protein